MSVFKRKRCILKVKNVDAECVSWLNKWGDNLRECAASRHFADLHVHTRTCTWCNAYLHVRMYGTLCFLALISNSMVFIYPGQFLPAFGQSQQNVDYCLNGLISMWSKHGKDNWPLLRASRFTIQQCSTCTHMIQYTHKAHNTHALIRFVQ
jgi:hypothetical protein